MPAWLLGINFKLIGAIAIAALFLAMGIALKVQTTRLDIAKREFAAFQAQVKAIGDVAEAKARAQEKADKAVKARVDNENQILRRNLADTSRRLSDERANSRFLPQSATGPASVTVTADRAGLEAALRTFDTGVARIVDEGDSAIADLNTGKDWIKSQEAVR